MSDRFFIIKNSVVSFFKNLIINHKFYLIVFGIFSLIGLLTGILNASNFSNDLEINNLINIYLYDFLCNKINFFSFFLILALLYLGICIFTILFIKNRFLMIVNTILLIILCYILGFDIYILVLTLGLSGIFFGLFVYGLLGILCFICYILLFAVVSKRYLNYKLGIGIYCPSDYKKIYFILIIIGMVVLFFLTFFLSIIHIFVIIN